MTDEEDVQSFLVKMPKVELHVHLEGTFRPATLLSLARKNKVALPADDEDGLRRWFRFRDFEHFIEIYITCSKCLREPEDFHVLALDFLAEQAMQNVVYSEVHFTISTHIWNGHDGEAVRQALSEAARDGEKRLGIRMRLIPDIVRNMEVARADATVRWALDDKAGDVVAIGMGGIEVGYSNEPFREHFRSAREGGLHCVAHAGETGGAECIRSALEVIEAERIGHGVRAVDDPDLIAELVRRRIPLEVCPSSNVALGVAPSIEEHPFDRLLRAGVAVTVNSDDPPLFGTNLTREYARLQRAFGYSCEQLARLSLASLEHAFLDDDDRAQLETRFETELTALGVPTSL